MFKIDRTNWGNWEVITLTDSSNNKMVLAPARGACLLDLQFNGESILEGYSNASELDSLDWGRSALLFPFPNRLEDGKYSWQGRPYQFPINDVANNNALHGFGISSKFKVEHYRLASNQAEISLGYHHKPTNSYPFAFKATISYTIINSGKFELKFEVENRHYGVIPFAFGWHPYFRLDDAGVGSWELKFPAKESIGLSDRMLPTGKRYSFDQFRDFQAISETVFDHCFTLTENEAQLRTSKNLLAISSPFGESPFPFFQVFTPPSRSSIALEPMSSNINSFNNQEGLWVLDRGARISQVVNLRYARLD